MDKIEENSVRSLLGSYSGSGKVVRLSFRVPEERLWCVPIKTGAAFVAVVNLHDFRVNGIKFIAIRTIESVQCESGESFYAQVLQGEGANWEATWIEELDLDSAAILLCQLSGHENFVSAEGHDAGGFFFHLGEIVGTGDTSFTMTTVDGAGEWDEEPSEIPYNEIGEITYGDHYATLLRKYAQRRT